MRTLGWLNVSAQDYRECYERFGGSVVTHPDVLDFLHARMPLAPQYLGVRGGEDGMLAGAACRWGDRLAGDERTLREVVQPRFDLGAPEIVLPCSGRARPWLRLLMFKTSHLSALSKHLFVNVRQVTRSRRQLALAKTLGDGGFSTKTKRRRRLDVRRFLAAGGQATRVHDHDASTLADIYRDLHHSRWGRHPAERGCLIELLTHLRHLLFGHVLWVNGQPVAYDFVLMARSPRWLSAECVNGGVDPRFAELSPGSVLIWLNLVEAWEQAQENARELRFSLGRMDREYKRAWCHPAPLFRSMTL